MEKLKKRPRIPQRTPEACLSCKSELGYRPLTESHEVPFKGELFRMDCTDIVCPVCGDALVPNGELTRRLEVLWKLYNEKHKETE